MTSTVTVHAAYGGALTFTDGEGLSVVLDGRPEVSEQLLGVAVAGCYANTLFAEAASRGVWLRSLDVETTIEWVDTPPRTQSVTVHIRIASEADEPTVMELVEHADRVSRVANSIRLRVPLRVADLRVTTVPARESR